MPSKPGQNTTGQCDLKDYRSYSQDNRKFVENSAV